MSDGFDVVFWSVGVMLGLAVLLLALWARFGDRVRHLPPFVGAATLETGELALVLETNWLSRRALEGEGEREEKPRFAGRRALLIEESADARSRIEPVLRSTGLEVITALDDDEAVAHELIDLGLRETSKRGDRHADLREPG